jgi:hypothetical protein
MKTLRALYHLARADFLERVQRYSFVVTLLAATYLGLVVVSGDINLHLAQYRGVFNSAWVGLLMAQTTTVFLTPAGFYLIKNAVDRDRQTGVGQILASSPVSRLTYLLGKMLSNLAVLGTIVIVPALAAVLTQLTAGEARQLDLWALLSPFIFLALPALVFVAGMAVFFETVPWLRGGFGNIVYFFLWLLLFCGGLETHNVYADFTGFQWVSDKVGDYLRQTQPDCGSTIGLSIGGGDEDLRSFVWPGFDWLSTAWWLRLYWFGVSFALILLGALFFDRFDPARAGSRKWGAKRVGARLPEIQPTQPVFSSTGLGVGTLHGSMGVNRPRSFAGFHTASSPQQGSSYATILQAELRLMFKGQPWWWYAGAILLLIASLANSLEKSREDLLPFVWLWPVLLWSQMGTREARNKTHQLLFNAPHFLTRQLSAVWLAGVILALGSGAGIGIQLALAQDWSGLMGWTVGALFIPTAALAMGVWSGSGKLFEGLFMVCWYIGPIQKIGMLNFMTTSTTAVSAGLPVLYLVATVALLGAAVIGRRRQMEMV